MLNVQMRQSAYLAPGHTFSRAGRGSVNMSNSQRLSLAQVQVSDLSVVYPDAVVASSDALGWQNIRAIEMRHDLEEGSMPPLENTASSFIGQPVQLSARIGGQSFDQCLQRAGSQSSAGCLLSGDGRMPGASIPCSISTSHFVRIQPNLVTG